MRKKSYAPSFLISAKIPEELHDKLAKYAATKGVTVEEVYREALKFYAAQCVHTHGRRKNPRR